MGKLLHTDLKMIFGSRRYYLTLVSTVLTAVFSLLFIKLIDEQYQFLSSDMIQMLKSSDSFNLYILKVKNIEDILSLSGADMMYLCFSGCFLPGVIACFSILTVAYGYKTGMVRFLVQRGYARIQIVLSKYLSIAVGVVGIVLVYLITSVIGGCLLGGFGNVDVLEYIVFLLTQIVIYIVFSFICIAVAFAFENEALGIVCMISLIIALPDMLKYLKIFFSSSVNYELLWILNYSSGLALGETYPVLPAVFLFALVCVCSIFISISTFCSKEIK